MSALKFLSINRRNPSRSRRVRHQLKAAGFVVGGYNQQGIHRMFFAKIDGLLSRFIKGQRFVNAGCCGEPASRS